MNILFLFSYASTSKFTRKTSDGMESTMTPLEEILIFFPSMFTCERIFLRKILSQERYAHTLEANKFS
jgi:hypothetical protein